MSRHFVHADLPLYVEPLWSDEPHRPQIDVPEHHARRTGLLDKHGNEIMRSPNPIGFTAKL